MGAANPKEDVLILAGGKLMPGSELSPVSSLLENGNELLEDPKPPN